MEQYIVITGGSSGIGQAVANSIAETKRYGLVLAGRDRKRLQEVYTTCSDISGLPVVPVAEDLSNDIGLASLVRVCQSIDSVFALVNNAGIGTFAHVKEFDTAALDLIMDTNFRAPFVLSREIAKLMIAQGKG